jgi:hypothetical protein
MSTGGAIAIFSAFAVSAVVIGLWRRWLFYGALFGAAHAGEIAELLASLKRDAFIRLSNPGPGAAVRATLTSKGLALSYSISAKGDRYLHYLAISLPGRITPHAAAHRVAHYLLACLGIASDQAILESTRSTVHHLRFVVDEGVQRRLKSGPQAIAPYDKTSLALLSAVSEDFPCHDVDGSH